MVRSSLDLYRLILFQVYNSLQDPPASPLLLKDLSQEPHPYHADPSFTRTSEVVNKSRVHSASLYNDQSKVSLFRVFIASTLKYEESFGSVILLSISFFSAPGFFALFYEGKLEPRKADSRVSFHVSYRNDTNNRDDKNKKKDTLFFLSECFRTFSTA